MAHPLDALADVSPSLSAWWEEFRGDAEPAGEVWLHLACELAETSVGRQLPDLPALAPLIENLLVSHDGEDQISLGFLESLLRLAEDGGLDSAWIRDTLGPTARRIWEDLYRHRHQSALCAIDWLPAHLEGLVAGPATLVQWLVAPGQRIGVDSVLARVTTAGHAAMLRTRIPCYVDRFVAAAGIALQLQDRLLYVLPSQESPIAPPMPYATLALEPNAPVAAG